MKLRLRPAELGEIESPELRERAEDPAKYTELFLAVDDGAEVGLLVIDAYPKPAPFHIHEIRVVESRRRMGVGTFLLRNAEAIAWRRRYGELTLHARPLTPHTDKERLADWYSREGYVPIEPGSEHMRKQLRPSVTSE